MAARRTRAVAAYCAAGDPHARPRRFVWIFGGAGAPSCSRRVVRTATPTRRRPNQRCATDSHPRRRPRRQASRRSKDRPSRSRPRRQPPVATCPGRADPPGAKTFKEGADARRLVKAGKLLTVDKRLPEEPLVLKPTDEVGKYGGNWRMALPGPTSRTWSATTTITSCTGMPRSSRWCRTLPKAGRSRRRQDHRPETAQGHEVVGRRAVHRRRHHVLVRGPVPERRPEPVQGVVHASAAAGQIAKVDDTSRLQVRPAVLRSSI